MRAQHLKLTQDVEAATEGQLKTLMKEEIQKYFRKWEERLVVFRGRRNILRGSNGTVSFSFTF